MILFGVISSFVKKGFKLFNGTGVCCGPREVGYFVGVGLVIVQFQAMLAVVPFGVTIAVGADGAAEGAGVFQAGQARADAGGAVGGFADGGLGGGKDRRETFAFEMLGLGETAKVGEGGVEVDQLGEGGAGLAGGFHAGHGDDERHAGAAFKEVTLLPQAVVAEVIAVVAEEHDDGVIVELEFFQAIEHAAEAGVHQGGGGVIGADDFLALLDGQLALVRAIGQGSGRNIVTIAGHFEYGFDFIQWVMSRVMGGRDVRRVRAVKTDGEEKGFAGLVRVIFLEEFHSSEGGLAIGVFLVFAVEQQPAHRAAVRAGAQGDDLVLLRAINADGVDDLVPRRLVVHAIGADLGGHAVMINLADARGKVAVIDEVLRKRGDVRVLVTEMAGVGEHAGLLRIQPGHER